MKIKIFAYLTLCLALCSFLGAYAWRSTESNTSYACIVAMLFVVLATCGMISDTKPDEKK